MAWYTGNETFDTWLAVGFGFAAFTLLGSLFAKSPYGRFASDKMGVNLNPKLGWWLMELPATVVFFWFYLQGARAFEVTPLALALVWTIHYGNRGWFFPLSLRVARNRSSTFSITVMLLGMFVTGLHGYLNATFFTQYAPHLTGAWLADPRFIGGLAVYLCGLFLTVRSEAIMRHLRDPNAAGQDYKIPYGGAFRYVSSPQYLGELTAWAGFALMTWGLPGVMIFLISAGNLVPRAFQSHRWYHERFPGYPSDRKAIIPFII
ncbi:3-oxo-5-alpha-steroid 4-dehydrogenase [Oleomonas cavernae]|uniref:3-oxo-5-alpha-steroid 4-dehydrogenase n=1 Tax=Oleomonas cavernae TaxID=2320859 RepID=A0A418W8E5_9PROT|nr:methyltransferase [Oleomonas cavernae]RJF86273.1 3-oxo-5-alpha-steroid 4-dehydrogenase [Oleomonas cavernae]